MFDRTQIPRQTRLRSLVRFYRVKSTHWDPMKGFSSRRHEDPPLPIFAWRNFLNLPSLWYRSIAHGPRAPATDTRGARRGDPDRSQPGRGTILRRRNRIKGEGHTKPEEQKRLLQFGKALGRVIEELLTIVSPSKFYRWMRDEHGKKTKNLKGGRGSREKYESL